MADLSHDLHSGFPWIPVPGITFPFSMEPIATIEEHGVAANTWKIHEHLGTQIDAPSHFSDGGRSVDQLRPDELFAPIVLLDFKQQALANADAQVTISHLQAWESLYGKIPKRAIVIMNSGWEDRIGSQQRFLNADADGTLHFPGFSAEATQWLIEHRDIWGLGVDTISFDPGFDKTYRSHRILAAANRWAIEAMANLDKLPPAGATLLIGAANVRGATGGLVRPIAVWDITVASDGSQQGLTGRWESRAPELLSAAVGDNRYLIRRFEFQDDRWSIHFTIYADHDLQAPLWSGHNAGTFSIDPASTDSGSYRTRFDFQERRLTPHHPSITAALEKAQCGKGHWQLNGAQDVLISGCESFRVFRQSDCEAEYDLLKVHGSMLYLGERPADGFMCSQASRPHDVGDAPLVRVQ